MATDVIKDNEVILNSTRYPLVGNIETELTSTHPNKVVIGDYTKASDPNKDTWVISDLTEGGLVEEMEEPIHSKRSWFSTCNTETRGHVVLPRLATNVSLPVATNVPTIVNSSMEDLTGWDYSDSTISRSDTQKSEVDSTVVDVQIAYTTDDIWVYWNGAAWVASSSNSRWVAGYGSASDFKYGGGGRFRNVTVPQGSVITSATLVFTAGDSQAATTVNTRITGEASDDASAFSNLADYQSRRGTIVGGDNDDNIIATQVDWDAMPAQTQDSEYTSPEIKTIIQAIVDRSGWESGNAMVLYWDDHDNRSTNSSQRARNEYSFDGDSSKAPQLHIEYIVSASQYSIKYERNNVGALNTIVDQYIKGWLPGVRYRFSCHIWGDSVNSSLGARIGIDDGQSITYSSYRTTTSFADVSVTKTLAEDAKYLRLILYNHNPGTASPLIHYFDIARLEMISAASAVTVEGTPTKFASYNSELYLAYGKFLMVLNSAGTAWLGFLQLEENITDIISSIDDKLYVYIGDSNNYYHVTTITHQDVNQSNSALADLGIHWDGKLFKLDNNTRTIYSSTDPEAASPTWTARGTIENIDADTISRLFIWHDADGEDIIYAATQKGLYAHDYTNTIWLETALTLPDHPRGGKGAATWRDTAYISSGLDIFTYNPSSSGAAITYKGLNIDSGVPAEYDGEIVNATGGLNALYVLVDSTQATGTSTSTVWGYNDLGWQCIWVGDATEKTMNISTISSIPSYNFWFDHDGNIYQIPLSTSLQNVRKIPSETFATSGFLITPWFDADWQVGNKLALALTVNVGGDVSADETVVVKYRTDHATTATESSWTTLGTISSSGDTAYTFGSNLGAAFKAIQFRFDLARAGASTTETPDLQYAVLSYKKILPKKWGWRFVIDCSRNYDGKSPDQLLDAIITASELGTLVPFVFKDTTKYVEIRAVSGDRLTGEGNKGKYTIFCSEL